MGSRWGREGPPSEAYGRVSDPQRYAALDGVADRLVASLRARFDVTVTDEPVTGPRDRSAIRLRPGAGDGADLVVVRSEVGVRLRAGRWTEQSFPSCGCDACDEEVDHVTEQLLEFAADVVGGRLEEELSRRVGGGTLSMRRPHQSSSTKLGRADVRQLGPPGRHVWAPWADRDGD
jgi:Family of unknown function (DUF6226)